ncbi:MAG TPA: ribonuclease P protein component [Candidatus Moranbacteria bacterium]|nr:ribonuclease P protein component [Candidatus Moranbacteria bacterium]
MLPRKNRITKKDDYDAIYRYGKVFFSEWLTLKAKRNNSEDTRVGIVVGFKFSKKAVERNNMKRQLREIFRKKLDEMEKGFDLVIIAGKKREKETVNIKKTQEITDKLLKKAKIIK